jgi:hypothetical protein
VVNLWTKCGGLYGKDGLRDDVFGAAKFLQFSGIYFFGGSLALSID